MNAEGIALLAGGLMAMGERLQVRGITQAAWRRARVDGACEPVHSGMELAPVASVNRQSPLHVTDHDFR